MVNYHVLLVLMEKLALGVEPPPDPTPLQAPASVFQGSLSVMDCPSLNSVTDKEEKKNQQNSPTVKTLCP